MFFFGLGAGFCAVIVSSFFSFVPMPRPLSRASWVLDCFTAGTTEVSAGSFSTFFSIFFPSFAFSACFFLFKKSNMLMEHGTWNMEHGTKRYVLLCVLCYVLCVKGFFNCFNAVFYNQ